MSEQSKTRLPKLRFPEFVDAGEWTVATLSNIATRVTLRNKNTTVSRVFTNSAVDGVVDQRDFFDKDIANQNNLENYFIVNEGCYVYNPRISNTAPVGPISKNKIGKGVMSPLYTVFKFHNADNDFYEQFFKTGNWYSYLRNISNSGARHDRMSISNDAFMEMPLPQTNPKEQQKIADCLSSLDDLITAQNQKVEALKQHKKGLMQQLFPAEGETVPKLRFPKFENDGEWALTEIGKFIEEYRKNSTHQDEHEVLTSARNGLIRQRDYFDNDRITERDNIGFNIIPPNYLTYRSRSDDRRFYFNENLLGITGIISTYYPVFKIKNGVNKFFVELLASYSDHVGKHSVGTSQTVLSLNVLKKIELPFPSPKEQKNIADCLSSLDDLITAQTQQLVAYKSHKKGLMQQLFPSLDEVEK